ncbi:MAG TPA: hypothetical protein VG028_13245, partial [Terriglobia bacterium]|nr:hypothetical protein [Terriglobia bacterium]
MALRLMSEVGLDGSGFSTGLNKLESSAHSALSGLKGFFIGAIGVGTVEQAISRTVETAKELVDTSKRLAIAPEQLQVLRQAAKQSGVELEDVAHAFEKIDEARQKAMLPGQEGQQFMGAFKELGIGSEQLHG